MTRARIAIAATDETGGAFQSVRQKLDTLGAEAASVSGRFAALGAGVLGLLGGAAAFGAFIQGATESVTRLKDLQDATGSSIDRLSGLTNLAGRAGLSFETVSGALLRFNQALNAAKPNSPIAQSIERLGLSVRELRDADPVEALQSVAQAFGRFADDGNKARLAQELFGRSIGQVAPLLKELAEDGELVASVTDRQAEAIDRLSKTVSRLSANWTILQQRIGGPLVESLANDVERLRIAGDVFGSTASGIAVLIGEARRFANAGDGVAFYTRQLAALNAQRAAAATEGNPLARRNLLASLDEEIARVGKLDEVYRRLARSTLPDLGQSDPRELARRGRGPLALPSVGGPQEDTAATIRSGVNALDRYTQGLRDQLLATQNLSTEEQTRISINRGLLGVLSEADKTQTLALARALDASRLLKANDEQSAALKAEGARLTASLRTEQEVLNDEIERADKLLQAGAINVDTWARAWERFSQGGIKDATDALQKLRDFQLPNLTLPLQLVDERARDAGRSIQDAFSGSILAAFKRDTGSILDIWGDMIQRLTAQALAARLTTALFGDLASTGQLGGLIGGALSFGGARANGGPVTAGRAYLVGERGPELIVPRSAGMVVPNDAMGGVQVHQHINVAAGVSRGELVAALQLSAQQTRAELMAELRARRVL